MIKDILLPPRLRAGGAHRQVSVDRRPACAELGQIEGTRLAVVTSAESSEMARSQRRSWEDNRYEAFTSGSGSDALDVVLLVMVIRMLTPALGLGRYHPEEAVFAT